MKLEDVIPGRRVFWAGLTWHRGEMNASDQIREHKTL
jgi:hypothetical protein